MSTIANLGAMGIVAIIIAIVATVLAFIFIVPEKRRAQMGAFTNSCTTPATLSI